MVPKLPFEVSSRILNPKGPPTNRTQVKNPSLFKDKSLVGGEWVEARSGKRFDVIGKTTFISISVQILILL
jgi:hypothetical protein